MAAPSQIQLAIGVVIVLFLLQNVRLMVTLDESNLGSLTTSTFVPPLKPPLTARHTRLQTDDSLFNYTAFWDKAWQVAAASAQRAEKNIPAPTPCPKVYVYDLPPTLTDSYSPHFEMGWRDEWYHTLKSKVFGSRLELRKGDEAFTKYLRHTQQYTFAYILEYRLRRSKECRTRDPQVADLFYVPVLTRGKAAEKMEKACSSASGEMVETALEHINATNACRHFFAFGKGHYNALMCKGWFSEPSKRLKPALRLAYSHFDIRVHEDGGPVYHSRAPYNITQSTYPNLFSVPYPSSFHFKAKPPLSPEPLYPQFATNRTVLISFIGKDNHGDTAVRQRAVQQCRQYHQIDARLCQIVDRWLPPLITEKAKAVFCLEPAGDSPWRKSLADSITLGCIPVLFSDLTDDVRLHNRLLTISLSLCVLSTNVCLCLYRSRLGFGGTGRTEPECSCLVPTTSPARLI